MADAAVRAAALLLDERVPAATCRARRSPIRRRGRCGVHRADAVPVARRSTRRILPSLTWRCWAAAGIACCSRTRAADTVAPTDIDVLRWRADSTQDDTGHWIYLKDLTSGALWSAAHQPVRADAAFYHATFATDRVSFTRRDGPVETRHRDRRHRRRAGRDPARDTRQPIARRRAISS